MLRYSELLAVIKMEQALGGYPMRDQETVGGWDIPTRGTFYGSGVPLQPDEIMREELLLVSKPGDYEFIGPVEPKGYKDKPF